MSFSPQEECTLPFPENDDDGAGSDRGGDENIKARRGWVLSAWDGAFFIPEVSTLSIGQH